MSEIKIEESKTTTNPDILKKILERGEADDVSFYAAQNPNCSTDTLKMVLERGNNINRIMENVTKVNYTSIDHVSFYALGNPNCPTELLIKIVERCKDDLFGSFAVGNPNCPPDVLRMVLKKCMNDYFAINAAENPNCPPDAKINWYKATGKIEQYDPKKHIMDIEEEKENTDLQKLKALLNK
jgi:hypothetical protein